MLRFSTQADEMSWSFTAYTHYFEDLAGVIEGEYGTGAKTLVHGVHAAVLAHGTNPSAQRRVLSAADARQLEHSLRRSWGALRRAHREIENPDLFDAESNAWLPVMTYYAVYHGVVAAALARGQKPGSDHRPALNTASTIVTSDQLPYPWSAHCRGCPADKTESFAGVKTSGATHVKTRWSPDPATSDDRLKQLLKTTRGRELERRFGIERAKKPRKGRSRRNVNRRQREEMAAGLAATTLFDVFWRLRKRANYEDADAFVFGAFDDTDARRLAQSLVIVGDATVAALEALVAMYVDPHDLARVGFDYGQLTGTDSSSGFGRHVDSLCALGKYPF